MGNQLPEFLKELFEKQYEKETIQKIIQGYQSKRNTTFRINTLKSNRAKIENVLQKQKIEYEKVKWSQEAIILKKETEKEIKNLDMYKKGEIYLQSLSSMLPTIILQPKQGVDILDMAAAPGGKTTQIAAMTENKANITACEIHKIRAERLKYNLEKQGAKAYIMTQDARTMDHFFSFDQILLDAPCSGSGTLNLQDCRIAEKCTIKLMKKSIENQTALLKKAMRLLKKGQQMVYSTCSIVACENEEIIKKILEQKQAKIVPIRFKGMEDLPLLPTKIEGTLCICPNPYYEGFFLAKIQKL